MRHRTGREQPREWVGEREAKYRGKVRGARLEGKGEGAAVKMRDGEKEQRRRAGEIRIYGDNKCADCSLIRGAAAQSPNIVAYLAYLPF
jgi:hypothetical protein